MFGVDTPVRVAAAVVMVVLGWALARDLGRFTRARAVPPHGPRDGGHGRLPHPAGVPVMAALLALRVAGLDPRTLAVGGAITAVVFGLAAQQTLGNLIAGLVLISARPFKVGDRVRLQAGGAGRPGRGRRGLAGPALHDVRAGPGLDHGPEQRRAHRRGRAAARAGGGRPARPAAPGRPAQRRPGAARGAHRDARARRAARSRSRRSTPTRSSCASARRRCPTTTARGSPTRSWPRSRGHASDRAVASGARTDEPGGPGTDDGATPLTPAAQAPHAATRGGRPSARQRLRLPAAPSGRRSGGAEPALHRAAARARG